MPSTSKSFSGAELLHERPTEYVLLLDIGLSWYLPISHKIFSVLENHTKYLEKGSYEEMINQVN